MSLRSILDAWMSGKVAPPPVIDLIGIRLTGYDAGSAMTYTANLKGRLLIYFGTADNNVHPSNSLELIRALQKAGKSFEVQVGPDAGHSGVNQQRMLEFFIENLIQRPERLLTK